MAEGTHQFDTDDRVAIVTLAYDRTFIVEGFASVRCRLDGDERYEVVFEGDMSGQAYERYVDPAAQADPEAFAQELTERMVQS